MLSDHLRSLRGGMSAVAVVLLLLSALVRADQPADDDDDDPPQENAAKAKVIRALPNPYKFSVPDAAVKPFLPGEQLSFEFGWQGITAAHARTSIDMGVFSGEPAWRLAFDTRTVKGIQWAYTLVGSCITMLDTKTFRPLIFTQFSNEDDRVERLVITYNSSDGMARQVKMRLRPSPKTSKVDIAFADAHDPISVFYLLRCMPQQIGSAACFEVVFGGHLYAFEARVVSHEKMKVQAGTFDAARMSLKVHNLDGDKKKREATEKKYKDLTAWISMGPEKLPLKLESSVFIGRVYAELVKYQQGRKPEDAPPEPEK